MTNEQKEKVGHGKKFYCSDYGVQLIDIQLWKTPRLVEDLVPSLKFIENKESWFAYFQGGVRQVSEEDFRTITEGRELPFSDFTQSQRRPALVIASLEGDVEIVNALRAQFSWTHIRTFLSIKDELKE